VWRVWGAGNKKDWEFWKLKSWRTGFQHPSNYSGYQALTKFKTLNQEESQYQVLVLLEQQFSIQIAH
jgi:hypothetical protein